MNARLGRWPCRAMAQRRVASRRSLVPRARTGHVLLPESDGSSCFKLLDKYARDKFKKPFASLSEGTPHEEALHVLPLDADVQVLDALELSAACTPGMLRNVSLVRPNIIRFSFFEPGETWHLEVAERPHRGTQVPESSHSGQ